MNILTDRLPDSVTVGGKKYPLNTDFRNWIIAGHIADIQTGRREDILKILFCRCFQQNCKVYDIPQIVSRDFYYMRF